MDESIGGMLERTLKKLGLGGAIAAIYWRQAVGDDVSRHAWPVRQIGKTLFVLTDSPVWSQELSFQKTDIIEKLAEKMGRGKISDIKFMTRGATEEESGQEEDGPAPPLSAAQQKEIAKLLEPVGETAVKDGLRQWIEKDRRENGRRVSRTGSAQKTRKKDG